MNAKIKKKTKKKKNKNTKIGYFVIWPKLLTKSEYVGQWCEASKLSFS